MMKEHFYGSMGQDQLEELFSNFLIDSWTYSKVTSFAKNEKEFEMRYIYGERGRVSASSVAGNAYHAALKAYFVELQETGKELSIVDLELIAFEYIDSIHPNKWKLQKTTPSVSDCILKANKTAVTAIKNFYNERSLYLDDLDEVLFVEHWMDTFVTVNGVDVPLPCHAIADLIVKTKSGKVVLYDHKSKTQFTDPKEAVLVIGKQAATYVVCFEAEQELKIDEVRFVENKVSENRDKSPQLNLLSIKMTKDNRMLFESLLYEPLKRMLEAVSNPDYVYLINEFDTMTDLAEIHDFWAKTMIAEIDEFNVPDSKKEMISKRLKKVRDANTKMINPKIIKKFKKTASEFIQYDLSDKNMKAEEKIEHILRSFSIPSKVIHTTDGYSSRTFLLDVGPGTKLSSVISHKMDIANALDVPNIRIMKELVMYNGKSYLAIECSKKRDKDLIFDKKYLSGLKIPVGVDNYENTIVWDLSNHSTPHALVCGATGSGKSVMIRSTIEFAKLAGINEIVIFDPKFEFGQMAGKGIHVYQDINEIEHTMKLLVDDMNDRVQHHRHSTTLVIFDEFADAVSAARSGKELDRYEVIQEITAKGIKSKRILVGRDKSLEENLKILLQKGRSSGFRILAATQRASVKVITGDAKVNFPVQICFRVPKEIDSKVVLDEGGAECLAGAGDGLMRSPEYSDLVRFQAFFKP